MKICRAIVLSLGSCALAATMFAPAYMKLGDIKGEAVDAAGKDGHKNEIEILSFSFGANQSGIARDAASGQASGKRDAASGLPTGKRQHKPVTITKPIDKSSPILARALASGDSIGTVEVSDGTTVHTLHDCVVTSITPVSSSGGDRPMESISLNYTKIEMALAKSKAADAGLRESPKRASTGKSSKTEKAP
jgi:type VI secretion system secreted protein Hcp